MQMAISAAPHSNGSFAATLTSDIYSCLQLVPYRAAAWGALQRLPVVTHCMAVDVHVPVSDLSNGFFLWHLRTSLQFAAGVGRHAQQDAVGLLVFGC